MKVSIKVLQVSMELGNNRIELDIYDNDENHLGDLRVGKATIEWCKGKTQRGNGIKRKSTDLIGWFENSSD